MHGQAGWAPWVGFLAGTTLFPLYHCLFFLFFMRTFRRFPRAFQITSMVWVVFPFLIASIIFPASYFDPGFSLLPDHD